MKKNLAKKITLSILAGAVLMSSSVVWADNPDIAGWNKNDNEQRYVWEGGSGGAPNGEVNKPSDKFTYDFYGALDSSYNGATGGKVTISGGTFSDASNTVDVFGGYSYGGSASHNEVVISGVVDGSIFGAIYGGSADGKAEGNTVALSAGNATYKYSIYGGSSDSGNATDNIVSINGGTFSGTSQGIYGAYSSSGDATGNIVNINDGTFSGGSGQNIYGGYSDSSSNATGNIVSINNITFGGFIYGGYSAGGQSNGNIVNLGNDVNLEAAWLYGGYSGNATSTGNTLNIGYDEGVDDVIGGTTITGYKSWTNGNSVHNISNFQTINFKNLIWEDKKTVLLGTGSISLSGTTIGDISIISGTVKNGEYMNLISADSINGTIGNISNSTTGNSADIDVTVYQGVANKITLDGKLEQVDNNNGDDVIKLTINDTDAANGITAEAPSNSGGVPGSSELNPQVLVIGESRTAAVAFTNQGSELIETGLDALARDNSKDTKVFAAVYGNHSEYETGSHVNVNGWSGIVGVGKTNANGLTVGAFFENGDGNYSTHNVTDFGYLRGDGEAVYNGGGFLVRKDNASGVYTEASLRAGNLKNELRGAVIGSQGEMGYDIDTFYYGAHIGVGKIIARGADGDSLDVYGKFIYTHHDGEDFEIDGDEFKFDSVDSERLRVGFRLNEVNGSKATMYYGAAWEYEFGGDADNKVVGYDLSTPSLEGSTVIGEIGMHYEASEKWSLDLNARAYTGQREGFSGSVQANYSF